MTEGKHKIQCGIYNIDTNVHFGMGQKCANFESTMPSCCTARGMKQA